MDHDTFRVFSGGPGMRPAEAVPAEVVLGRSRPWPKPSLAEAVLGRSRPWPKPSLAEAVWPKTAGRRRPGRRRPWPKTALAEAGLGRSRPWPKPSGRRWLAEAGLGRSRLVAPQAPDRARAAVAAGSPSPSSETGKGSGAAASSGDGWHDWNQGTSSSAPWNQEPTWSHGAASPALVAWDGNNISYPTAGGDSVPVNASGKNKGQKGSQKGQDRKGRARWHNRWEQQPPWSDYSTDLGAEFANEWR